MAEYDSDWMFISQRVFSLDIDYVIVYIVDYKTIALSLVIYLWECKYYISTTWAFKYTPMHITMRST